jgi:hypothetical protein
MKMFLIYVQGVAIAFFIKRGDKSLGNKLQLIWYPEN